MGLLIWMISRIMSLRTNRKTIKHLIHFITIVELCMELHTITEHTCIYIKYCFHLSQSLSIFQSYQPCYVSSASTVADDMAVCCLLTLCPLNKKWREKITKQCKHSFTFQTKVIFISSWVWTMQPIYLTKTLDHISSCVSSCFPLLLYLLMGTIG